MNLIFTVIPLFWLPIWYQTKNTELMRTIVYDSATPREFLYDESRFLTLGWASKYKMDGHCTKCNRTVDMRICKKNPECAKIWEEKSKGQRNAQVENEV